MTRKNLILTTVHQYDYPLVEPFIKSLKESGYKDDLVIFISEVTPTTTKRLLKRQGAILVEFQSSYPFIDDYADVFQDIFPSITINNYRFLFYLKYLEKYPDVYENIMLTDSRDVVFQKNIFESIKNNQIYFFLEDPSEVFRSSKMNYDWCLNANGPAITNKIIDENVSCAGIVLGNHKLILDYLFYIQSNLRARNELGWGLDQGIHNAYVYTVPNERALTISNDEALVLTLGACKKSREIRNGYLTNDQNEPYSVVHQYDRFGDLIVYFKRKYLGNRLTQIFKKVLFKILP